MPLQGVQQAANTVVEPVRMRKVNSIAAMQWQEQKQEADSVNHSPGRGRVSPFTVFFTAPECRVKEVAVGIGQMQKMLAAFSFLAYGYSSWYLVAGSGSSKLKAHVGGEYLMLDCSWAAAAANAQQVDITAA